jgi:hypothetical protein
MKHPKQFPEVQCPMFTPLFQNPAEYELLLRDVQ